MDEAYRTNETRSQLKRSRLRDSNPRPSRYKGDALPPELSRHFFGELGKL